MSQQITVPVKLDVRTFRRFACYDAFRKRKRWIRPAVFCLIFLVFAFIALLAKKEESGMVAAVLLVIGIGLPVIWLGIFLSQVNIQAEKYRLAPDRKVYTVILSDQGIRVENNRREESLSLPWSHEWQAIRHKRCTYLYVTAQKAFLLPDGQADAPDHEMWKMIELYTGHSMM